MVVWTLTNYFLVIAEMACVTLIDSAPVRSWRAKYSSPVAERVLKGVFCAFSLIGTFGSCFFFLTDYEIASGTLRKLLVFPMPLLPVLLGLYCKAQVAMDIFDWEEGRRTQNANGHGKKETETFGSSSSPNTGTEKSIASEE
ncbi:uncharacterized protein LOC144135328 [Amblyomma americanum]